MITENTFKEFQNLVKRVFEIGHYLECKSSCGLKNYLFDIDRTVGKLCENDIFLSKEISLFFYNNDDSYESESVIIPLSLFISGTLDEILKEAEKFHNEKIQREEIERLRREELTRETVKKSNEETLHRLAESLGYILRKI